MSPRKEKRRLCGATLKTATAASLSRPAFYAKLLEEPLLLENEVDEAHHGQ